MTRANPKFWELIEEARRQPTISLAEAKKHFQEADELEAKHGRPMTPAAAKKLVSFGVSQPRSSDLVRGKIEIFGIDGLVDMLAKARYRVSLVVRKERRVA